MRPAELRNTIMQGKLFVLADCSLQAALWAAQTPYWTVSAMQEILQRAACACIPAFNGKQPSDAKLASA